MMCIERSGWYILTFSSRGHTEKASIRRYILEQVKSIILTIETIQVPVVYNYYSIMMLNNGLWCIWKICLAPWGRMKKSPIRWRTWCCFINCTNYPSICCIPSLLRNNPQQLSMMWIQGSGWCFLAPSLRGRMRRLKYDGNNWRKWSRLSLL